MGESPSRRSDGTKVDDVEIQGGFQGDIQEFVEIEPDVATALHRAGVTGAIDELAAIDLVDAIDAVDAVDA